MEAREPRGKGLDTNALKTCPTLAAPLLHTNTTCKLYKRQGYMSYSIYAKNKTLYN